MQTKNKRIKLILTIVSLAALLLFSWFGQKFLDSYQIRLLNMWGIYIIMVVGFNLIYGFTGQFSLAHQLFHRPAHLADQCDGMALHPVPDTWRFSGSVYWLSDWRARSASARRLSFDCDPWFFGGDPVNSG